MKLPPWRRALRATAASLCSIGLSCAAAWAGPIGLHGRVAPPANARTAQPFATIGSNNPVTPQPPIARPRTASCSVSLIVNHPFQDFNPALGTFTPPAACPAPWAKVVLDWHVKVAGRQFDRIAALWIGNTEILRTSTSEPTQAGIAWHVEKDVTRYSPIFTQPQPFAVELGNVVDSTYTGIYYVTSSLTFYEPGPNTPASDTADVVLPIYNAASNQPWYSLNDPTQLATTTLTLPRNVERADLEVYATAHICDEFWYANESTAYSEATFGSPCGGGAFRELDVFLDGKLAGVAWPYPVVYTGGASPVLWRPLPGVNALDIPPYRVNLTPYAGVLSDGQQHTVAIGVVNDTGFWLVDADLLLHLDHLAMHTSGQLTSNTLKPAAHTTVDESQLNAKGGTAKYTGARSFTVAGFVVTSHGTVYTALQQSMRFDNHQELDNPNSAETVTSRERVATTTTVAQYPGKTLVDATVESFPIDLNVSAPPPPPGSPYFLILNATVDQRLQRSTQIVYTDGTPIFASTLDEKHKGTSLLEEGTGVPTVAQGKVKVDYAASDSTGLCYGRQLGALNELLTLEARVAVPCLSRAPLRRLLATQYDYYPGDL